MSELSAALQQFALEGEPWLLIDATYPDIALPSSVWPLVKQGRFMIRLTRELSEMMKFDLDSFTVEGLPERFHVPGGALLGVKDFNTGKLISFRPDADEPEVH